jgi:uncharacterized membrane protein
MVISMKFQDIVRIVVYTAITFIATVLLVIETPATGGYFNLGEASIYVIAFMSSPIVAAVSSGLGPALADLFLGYWYFAPATFVIKFCEGFVVSKLAMHIRNRGSTLMRMATVFTGMMISLIVAIFLSFGGGAIEAEFSWAPTTLFGITLPIPSFRVVLPAYIWLIIAFAIAFLSIAVLARIRLDVFPMAIGGGIMVLGYFFYEYFISNPLILGREAIAAIFEVPVNIGQFTVGILIAYPVVQFIEKAKGFRS